VAIERAQAEGKPLALCCEPHALDHSTPVGVWCGQYEGIGQRRDRTLTS
jgi:hypothetical protein